MSTYQNHSEYPTNTGWYCIVFEVSGPEGDEPDFGPIYYFDGECWSSEDGDSIDSLYDPDLHLHVAVTGADYYVPQS